MVDSNRLWSKLWYTKELENTKLSSWELVLYIPYRTSSYPKKDYISDYFHYFIMLHDRRIT